VACCDWDTFKESFLAAWRTKNVGEALIDWPIAKKDWKRHHCTGAEAVSMQMGVLAREADYLWLERFNNRNRGSDDDGGVAMRPRVPVLT
jgi:hypothetical protein